MQHGNKTEIYLIKQKECIHDKIMLLNAKINKNSVEIEKIDKKIREINSNVDIAMEVFSPHTQMNTFTRDEIHSLSEQKKILIINNDESISCIQDLSNDEKNIEEALTDLQEALRERDMSESEELDNIETVSNDNIAYNTGISILHTQELERQRIARELHDSPVQVLTNCIHKAELCSKVIDIDPVRAKLELEILTNTIRSTINEMRSIIYDLRPMAFDDLGFEISLERIINQIKTDSIMNIDIIYEGEKIKVPSLIGLSIVRIIQESCNNSIKHSKGKNIKINFTYLEKSIKLFIEDDGEGYDQSKIKPGFGLSIMRERVYLLSGKITVESNKSGTKIMVEIPLDGGETSEH